MTDTTGRRPIAVYTDVDDTDPAAGIALLKAHGFEVRVLGTRDPAEIVAGAQDADALLPGYAAITQAMIEQLPNLKVIALMSMGFDYVDVDAATEHGVWVTNLPGVATQEVATHALAILLASVRQLPFYTASATPTRWNDRSPQAPPRMSELTLGVIGLGRIGREFARLAAPHFGGVLGYDPMLPETEETQADLTALDVTRASLAELRRGSNVVSLHLPLTAETERMVDAAFLAELPVGAFLVNVSRGALVDSAALAAALDEGRLAGVALDVLDAEPPAPGHPLLARDDVILTPHVAYLSRFTEAEYVRIQAQNVITLLESGFPDTPVNRPA